MMSGCSKRTIDGTLEGAVKRERHDERRNASGPREEKYLLGRLSYIPGIQWNAVVWKIVVKNSCVKKARR